LTVHLHAFFKIFLKALSVLHHPTSQHRCTAQ